MSSNQVFVLNYIIAHILKHISFATYAHVRRTTLHHILLKMFFVYDMIVSSTICLSCDTKGRMLVLMVIELQREFQDNAIFKFTKIPVFTVSCESISNRHHLLITWGKTYRGKFKM